MDEQQEQMPWVSFQTTNGDEFVVSKRRVMSLTWVAESSKGVVETTGPWGAKLHEVSRNQYDRLARELRSTSYLYRATRFEIVPFALRGELQAIYVYTTWPGDVPLEQREVARTVEVIDGINVDYLESGEIAGCEVLRRVSGIESDQAVRDAPGHREAWLIMAAMHAWDFYALCKLEDA